MTRQEFVDKIAKEKPDLGEWQIETEIITDAGYVIGCVYDNGIWKIYKTRERLGHYIIDELDNENEAFDELYELVCIQKRDTEKRKY